MTSGKQLLFEDLPFSIAEIHSHYQNGYIAYRRGLEDNGRSPCCIRCGNDDPSWFGQFPCARCGKNCSYCRKCIMMGRISSCTSLISWCGPEPEMRNELTFLEKPGQDSRSTKATLLAWTGKLSKGQIKASNQVVETVAMKQKAELLVWAVCGAGKTEVLFTGIEQALLQGQRVCIATPRTDVVLELTPRLKAAFPTIPIASLYGGSPERHLFAPLTISTTHQLLRFYQAFDTIIVDEVDAFPYSADETLQHAVNQARKPASTLIYLTATPNKKWQKQCRQGSLPFVTIPARYHRHPLPVPEFAWCGNWNKQLRTKKTFPVNVLKWLEKRLKEEKQALLFLPKIELISEILPLLKTKFPNKEMEGVHAEDPARKEKVLRMRNREISILLTTTILERGVTFPNIDVAVLGAEDRIFTESALVQIAGRVGRSADFPSGNITFFHFGKTEAMVRARQQIIEMNKEARQAGLVDY
ncbi:DEAD/DEAH box helicase [Neobacillus sp. LXY-4]|uniref:DEAD/DEAH box helicase n=1 Tax=Neobacillus sp. LXY-4 TaxID=3379826 RepID=UPI003EE25322